jgi:hypothetical protein
MKTSLESMQERANSAASDLCDIVAPVAEMFFMIPLFIGACLAYPIKLLVDRKSGGIDTK